MIKTQIIKENNKPKMVIMDFKEYMRMKEALEDATDYKDAVMAEKKSKKLTKLEDLEKKLGI